MTSPQRFVIQSPTTNQPVALTALNEGYVQATSIVVDNNKILLDNKNSNAGDTFDDKNDNGDEKCLLLESNSLKEENQNMRYGYISDISNNGHIKLQSCHHSTNVSNFSLENNESNKFESEIESSLSPDKFDYTRNLGCCSVSKQPAAKVVTGYVAATLVDRRNSSQSQVDKNGYMTYVDILTGENLSST